MNKKLTQIGTDINNLEFIEPTNVLRPVLILSQSQERNVMDANYVFIEAFARYYFIKNYTFEYERIIVECEVDPLMSWGPKITQEKVILDRSSSSYSLYMEDPEVKLYNYSSFKTVPMDPTGSMYFSDTASQMVMVCSGNQ